ncbi:MAG: MOSC domain-containing protein [Alphaproteobacteria bacterium]|nr:MOSC domain-containing protein [Alphaproteobacteria bacterium]
MARLAALYRYPVKGMSAEAVETADLEIGGAIPHDRVLALAHGSTRFDPEAPEWMSKTNFFMLQRNERLAALGVRFDPHSRVLTVSRDGRAVARGEVSTPVGRAVIEQFFGAYLADEARGAPRLVAAEGHVFMDVPGKTLSLINRASVKDLERVAAAPVDPLRFRGNLLIEGAEPWAEFGWVGRELAIGQARFRVPERINRCAAVNVDPVSAKRDLNLLKSLMTGYGHTDMGIYLEVIAPGRIAVGDEIRPVDTDPR